LRLIAAMGLARWTAAVFAKKLITPSAIHPGRTLLLV
jgi:hypothetical protein